MGTRKFQKAWATIFPQHPMSCTREWKDCLMKVKGWEFSPLFTEYSPCRPPSVLCQDASHSLPAPSWHPPPPPPTQGRLSSRLCYLTSLASCSPSWEAGSQHHCPSFTDRATESFFYCYWTKVNQLEPVSHSKALEPDPSSYSWRRPWCQMTLEGQGDAGLWTARREIHFVRLS